MGTESNSTEKFSNYHNFRFGSKFRHSFSLSSKFKILQFFFGSGYTGRENKKNFILYIQMYTTFNEKNFTICFNFRDKVRCFCLWFGWVFLAALHIVYHYLYLLDANHLWGNLNFYFLFMFQNIRFFDLFTSVQLHWR